MNADFQKFKAAVSAFEGFDRLTNEDKSEEITAAWLKAHNDLSKAATKVGKTPDEITELVNLITEYNERRFHLVLI